MLLGESANADQVSAQKEEQLLPEEYRVPGLCLVSGLVGMGLVALRRRRSLRPTESLPLMSSWTESHSSMPTVVRHRHVLSQAQATRLMQMVALSVALDPRGISPGQIDAILRDLVPDHDKLRRSLVEFVGFGFLDRLSVAKASESVRESLAREFSDASGLKMYLARWATLSWARAFVQATKTLELKG